MAYDPAYSEPADWDNEVVSDTKLNQMKDNTHHNYKYKPECGPDTPNLKLARGYKDITVTSGNTSGTAAVAFATDCDDGDPEFSNTPRILITFEYLSGTFHSGAYYPHVRNVDADGFDIYFQSNTSHGSDLSVRVHWQAIGD